MKKFKTNGFKVLSKKVSAILGTALVALSSGNATTIPLMQTIDSEDRTIEYSKSRAKIKPMTVLKLNSSNLDQCTLVAQHRSHSSHSSHSSHRSHVSITVNFRSRI